MNQKSVEQIKEPIFFCKKGDGKDIHEQISLFLSRIYKKHLDSFSDTRLTAEAIMMITPDAFAAKVAENTGAERFSHDAILYSLIKYLCPKSNRNHSNYGDEVNSIIPKIKETGVFVRAMDLRDEMQFLILGRIGNKHCIQTDFQLEVLEILIDCMKEFEDSHPDRKIRTSFISGINYIEPHYMNEKMYYKLKSALVSEHEHLDEVNNATIHSLTNIRNSFKSNTPASPGKSAEHRISKDER